LDNYLYAVNPDGSLKWKFETGNEIKSTPAIAKDGTIYVGTHGGGKNFYALNPDGTLKWDFNADGHWIDCPIAIDKDGTIYFGSAYGTFYAVNPDGSEKWNYNMPVVTMQHGSSIENSAAIDNDGTIYFNNRGYDTLTALYVDGKYKRSWSGGYASPAIGSDDTIYTGSYFNQLFAVDRDGGVKWNFITDGPIDSSPVIDENGIIYVGCRDGYLYAVDTGIKSGLKNTPWPMLGQNPRHTSNAADYEETVNVEDSLPTEFYLQNYPNPFNSSTIIKYKIPENTKVNLDVYNISGQKIKTLVDRIESKGLHQVKFDASNLSSGVYFYQLKIQDGIKTEKMLLVK